MLANLNLLARGEHFWAGGMLDIYCTIFFLWLHHGAVL